VRTFRAQRAIRLFKKHWQYCANGAVVLAIPGQDYGPWNPPRRHDGRGGASVVAAIDAAPTEGIPMSKERVRRKPTPQKNQAKTAARRVQQRSLSTSVPRRHPTQQVERADSKQTRILGLLRSRRASRLTQLRRRPDGSNIQFVDSCQGWCARSSV
jgi:hypothetical protein